MALDLAKYKVAAPKPAGAAPGKLDLSKYKVAPPVAPGDQPAEKGGGTIVGNAAGAVGRFLTSNERGFGADIAGAVIPHTASADQYAKARSSMDESQRKFVETVLARKQNRQALGMDTSKEDEQLANAMAEVKPSYGDFNPASKKTGEQVAGDALGVAADIASFGTYGKAAKGAQAGKLLVQGAGSKVVAPILEKAGIGATALEKTAPTAVSKAGAFAEGAIRGAVQAAPIGAAYGAAQGLQENGTIGKIVEKAAVSGTFAGVVGGVAGGLANLKNRTPESIKEEAIAQYKKGLNATKEKYKEMTNKVIPDLLESKTWGTRKYLLRKAEAGIKLSSSEYEQLGELQGTVETPGIFDAIDKQIAEYSQGGRAAAEKSGLISKTIANHTESAAQVVDGLTPEALVAEGGMPGLLRRAQINISDSLRAKGLTEVGDYIDNLDIGNYQSVDEFRRQVSKAVEGEFGSKPVSVNVSRVTQLQKLRDDLSSLALFNAPKEAYQQDLRELAQHYGDVIYETRKSLKTVEDSATLSQVRKVDIAIRDLLNTNNPAYAKINKVYTLNSRLFDILDETAKRKEGHALVSWLHLIAASTGGTLGGVVTAVTGAAGAVATSVASLGGGIVALGLVQMLNSSWYNTLRAVQKAQLAEKVTKIGTLYAAQYWTRLLTTQGVSAANKLLSTPDDQLDAVQGQE